MEKITYDEGRVVRVLTKFLGMDTDLATEEAQRAYYWADPADHPYRIARRINDSLDQ